MTEVPTMECDLAIVGRGMAGMAATLFAANRGISAVQVGMIGELIFASGLLDLLAVGWREKGILERDPWAAMDLLSKESPKHPYVRLKREEIETAFEEVVSFLEMQGLPYSSQTGQNTEMITPLGTIKQTYCAPRSMLAGIQALREKAPCLVVDFHGLTDFSGKQISAALQDKWPGIRSARVPFPGNSEKRELVTGDIMAETMELSKNREDLARDIRPLVNDAHAVGIPAVLGMEKNRDILEDLRERIGVPVFEIPTFPVSVPGLRLNNAFVRGLGEKAIKRLGQSRVLQAKEVNGGAFVLTVGRREPEMTLRARGVVLATGRFWSRGLVADRKRIREPLFNLPVHQPETREQWHRVDFLDLKGHPVNRAGVDIDDCFRPLDGSEDPAFERLFAAGSILAHQDWKRMKCGSGLAISSAYKAVEAFWKMR
ncbi:MAG: glycerol-3-phosphate dehydrogenase subunit GlpB [Deltaproteobacteria bacterium]|nr:glycerol-3-phosphate dehydrogenase subunit GlpB [Deltaproteobacteria bacterium]